MSSLKYIAFALVSSMFLFACGDTTTYKEKCGEESTVLTGGPGNVPRNVDHEACEGPKVDTGSDTGVPEKDDTGTPDRPSKPDTWPGGGVTNPKFPDLGFGDSGGSEQDSGSKPMGDTDLPVPEVDAEEDTGHTCPRLDEEE